MHAPVAAIAWAASPWCKDLLQLAITGPVFHMHAAVQLGVNPLAQHMCT